MGQKNCILNKNWQILINWKSLKIWWFLIETPVSGGKKLLVHPSFHLGSKNPLPLGNVWTFLSIKHLHLWESMLCDAKWEYLLTHEPLKLFIIWFLWVLQSNFANLKIWIYIAYILEWPSLKENPRITFNSAISSDSKIYLWSYKYKYDLRIL